MRFDRCVICDWSEDGTSGYLVTDRGKCRVREVRKEMVCTDCVPDRYEVPKKV